ncbi:MAG TPA: hypothetical protein VG649_15055 [Candidatus Angelobacter sp.]|jgi:hypothetical protein|nr:hypothetical protein [Candidatus Angelobacter sp.]
MGKLKGFLILLIIFGGFYVGWNLIPPYFNNKQFQDDLDDIARIDSYSRRSDEDVRGSVIKKAEERGISLKGDEITVSRISSGIAISVHYRVHIDMILHPVDLDFTADSMNRRNI